MKKRRVIELLGYVLEDQIGSDYLRFAGVVDRQLGDGETKRLHALHLGAFAAAPINGGADGWMVLHAASGFVVTSTDEGGGLWEAIFLAGALQANPCFDWTQFATVEAINEASATDWYKDAVSQAREALSAFRNAGRLRAADARKEGEA